jgi:predicted Mrr-cat superfamily restriction endonuclease
VDAESFGVTDKATKSLGGGGTEILDALFEVYDQLSEQLRAALPLRRIWIIVSENEEAGA